MNEITTPWYETLEAQSLLIKAALSGVQYQEHSKSYALTRDTWFTAQGTVADRLKAICTQAGDEGFAAMLAGLMSKSVRPSISLSSCI